MAPSEITTQEKKFKVHTVVAIVMACIFLDSNGILLVKFLERAVHANIKKLKQ
jgi:hypothetical protein